MTVEDNLDELSRILESVRHSAPSVSKYRHLEGLLATFASIPPGRIYPTYVNKAGNLSVRMAQSDRAKDADLLVAVITRTDEDGPMKDAANKAALKARKPMLLLQQDDHGRWAPSCGFFFANDPKAVGLMSQLIEALGPFDEIELNSAEETDHAVIGVSEVPPPEEPAATEPPPSVRIDPRTRRMLENAIASHRAVMLVGPPGTGKSSLVHEIVREIREDPSRYGMKISPELMVVTANESWTTRELVGGESIQDDGNLRFVPGYALQAIQEDKWLLVDELNRADMDRIFGPILTWLGGDDSQTVNVGRAAPGDPTEVLLGWAATPESQPVEEELEGESQGSRTVRYAAGQEWRIIGTYNSLDAQRVFRLGLALGRRFAQIPIAPPSPDTFEDILAERSENFGLSDKHWEEASFRISQIYRLHSADPATAMGPALFLALPKSMAVGLRRDEDAALVSLLAEAYLLCFGPWLQRLSEETWDLLGEGMAGSDALAEEWGWVRQQLVHMG